MRSTIVAQKRSRPIPAEGGWGIVVVIAAHLKLAFLFGLMRGFGVLYLSWKTEFEASAKETAAVQSLITAVSCFSGAGLGISFNAGLVAVAMYFKRKYKVAHAVAFSGIGTGIMALPPVFQQLLDSYGWRGAVLVISAIVANVVVCGALLRPRYRRRSRRTETSHDFKKHDNVSGDSQEGITDIDHDPICDDESRSVMVTCSDSVDPQDGCTIPCRGPEIQTDKLHPVCEKSPVIKHLKRVSSELGLNIFLQSYRFSLLCLTLFEFSGPYAAFAVFIVPRAQSISKDGPVGTGVVTPSRAAFLISALGIGSLVGQLGNGLLISWKISAVNVSAACLFLCGVSSLLINADEYAVLVVASIVQGFSTGAFYAITVVLTRRFVGMGYFAICTGLFHIFMGVGMLSGPILAGWLFDETSSYNSVYYMLAGIYFICALQMLLVPLLKRLEPGMDIKPLDK
ncbi:monocarboxylate transporter 12-like [Patiria miniata]|uniref:Major facilitator superfamily (MFS) profile domain-containing protein n=1 Tax=Patiria miniata TaxID=46514 RepID=A0A914B1P6_PATMI|nr:monocarboxylate transporter 12-like [Patiria miniata]